MVRGWVGDGWVLALLNTSWVGTGWGSIHGGNIHSRNEYRPRLSKFPKFSRRVKVHS